MNKTVTQALADFGQSIWLDNLSRSLIESGKLQELVSSGVRGVTSNPTIFDKAISQTNDYDNKIKALAKAGKSSFEIYDDLTIADVREAADIFRPVYDRSNRLDGYVSLEVNPKLAHSAQETIAEAKRLHKNVGRPNLMLKVAATEAGLAAVEELLAEGLNVNATLIFSLGQYSRTAAAYIQGLKRLAVNNGDLSRVRSVASVFVSRLDTACDALLRDESAALKGKAAVANAALIYRQAIQIFSGSEFQSLRSRGANIQRPLWASTGTKNPSYSEVKYVAELIARDTVNTMPDKTLEAFLKNGQVKEALTKDAQWAVDIVSDLKKGGIDIDVLCEKLLKEGIIQFENSFDSLLKSIEGKMNPQARSR